MTKNVYSALSTKLGELYDKIEEQRRELEEAKNYAEYAKDEASNAQDQAGEAMSSAGSAEDQVDYAMSTLQDIEECYNALSEELEKLKNLSGDTSEGDDPKASGLEADIRKHRRIVLTMTKSGATPAQIAAKLEISRILVDQIIRRSKETA